MLMFGTGISTKVPINIIDQIEFEPQLALEWFELSDGNMRAVDRSNKNDYVTTTIRTHGKEDYIDDIIKAIDDNKKTDGILLFDTFASDEFLFGHNVDYTQEVSAVPTEISLKKQKSWKGFELSMSFHSSNIQYLTGSGTLPPLKCVQIGYTGDTTWDFGVSNTYRNTRNNGEINIYNRSNSVGVFTGTYYLSNEEMRDLLYFQKTQRSAPFTLPDVGVPNPFGVKQSGPFMVTLESIKRITQVSPVLVRCEIKFNQFVM